MEKKFTRDIQSLEKIFEFIDEFASGNHLDDSITFAITLVAEELFTNVVKYNLQSQNDVGISLIKEDNKITIVITDHSSQRFDIAKTEPVDTTQPLHERKAGGLGIHLVKNFVDEIDYQFINGVSKITLTKYLGR